MVLALNEREREALTEKMSHPEDDVKCPRCGNDLRYEEIGTSVLVKCETEKCIKGGIRGL